MAIIQQLARLTADDLYVEAGFTGETTIEVGPFAGATDEEIREFAVRVSGLPEKWYTLSTERLRLPSGSLATILLVVHPPHDDAVSPLGTYEFVVELSPTGSQESISLPGRLVALAPGARSMRSHLVQYLPAIFQDDLFLARFLLIFQSVLDPIEHIVDNTHNYLDASLTPASFLPWLASWVGVTFDPGLDEARQRELIRQAVELSRWKGTRRGLSAELRVRTGARPLIVENFDGMRLGQDAALGINSQLGAHREGSITVTLASNEDTILDQQQAEAMVLDLKPAHVGHIVRVVRAPAAPRGESIG
jgi:phage tail-like protein